MAEDIWPERIDAALAKAEEHDADYVGDMATGLITRSEVALAKALWADLREEDGLDAEGYFERAVAMLDDKHLSAKYADCNWPAMYQALAAFVEKVESL